MQLFKPPRRSSCKNNTNTNTMNKFSKFENVIMAFASFLGHAWVAREMVGYFEEEKEDREP